VYVAQEKSFAMRLVRVGADHGSAGVEIWAGLKEGDMVAVDAVQAGMKGAYAAR
jgi:putative IMPACT (imprinted ancient) family translation regulator